MKPEIGIFAIYRGGGGIIWENVDKRDWYIELGGR